MKRAIWLGMTVGSVIGGYVPALWGAGMLSFSSLLFGAIGGMIGIVVAFRLTR